MMQDPMSNGYDVNRFVKAHDKSYENALQEIKNGRKKSHWMWYIFPQIQGLGMSETSIFYAIRNIEEARAYMDDKILRSHMLEICEALVGLEESDASRIFGYPDYMKLHSSMTLFCESNPEYEVFQKILNKFFDGGRDEKTMGMIGR